MHENVQSPLGAVYLDPHASLLVIHEDHELDLINAADALTGLAWVFGEAASLTARLRDTKGKSVEPYVTVPSDGMAALLRLVAEKIRPAAANPPLDQVLQARPDLVQGNWKGN